MNAGVITGIVVGVLVVLTAIISAAIVFLTKKKRVESSHKKSPFTHSGGTLPIVVVNQKSPQTHLTHLPLPSGHGENYREPNFGNGENGPTLTVQNQRGDNLTMIPVQALRYGGQNPIPNWGRRSERKSRRSLSRSARRNQRSKSSTA